jgi:hypothetical protein
MRRREAEKALSAKLAKKSRLLQAQDKQCLRLKAKLSLLVAFLKTGEELFP